MGMLSDILEYCGGIIGFDMLTAIRGLVDIAFLQYTAGICRYLILMGDPLTYKDTLPCDVSNPVTVSVVFMCIFLVLPLYSTCITCNCIVIVYCSFFWYFLYLFHPINLFIVM